MTMVRLKYPCRIGGVLHPAGLAVPVLDASDAAVQALFPGIATSEGSRQVAVLFPNLSRPTICSVSQLRFDEEVPR